MHDTIFRELYSHCSDLSFFLYDQSGNEDYFAWSHIGSWLFMASSVEKVVLNTEKINPSSGYCSLGDEYDGEREELYSQIATELARFNFIWCALEAIIDYVVPKILLKQARGKINGACLYLDGNLEFVRPLPLYGDALYKLRTFIIELPHYEKLNIDFSSSAGRGQSSIALSIIYKIRNNFAHGSLELPEPEKWSGVKNLDADIINTCSRLILMTIQMLLLSYYKTSNIKVEPWWIPYEYETILYIHEYLRGVHLEIKECDEDQINLPF